MLIFHYERKCSDLVEGKCNATFIKPSNQMCSVAIATSQKRPLLEYEVAVWDPYIQNDIIAT